MQIIPQMPNPSGAYPPIQTVSFDAVPAGTARWPEDLSTDTFYQYNGFVALTISDLDGVATVTGCQPNAEAWETWRASLPEEPEAPAEPEGPQSDVAAMAMAYRQGVDEA